MRGFLYLKAQETVALVLGCGDGWQSLSCGVSAEANSSSAKEPESVSPVSLAGLLPPAQNQGPRGDRLRLTPRARIPVSSVGMLPMPGTWTICDEQL